MSLFLARQFDKEPTSSSIEEVRSGKRKKEMILMMRFPETPDGIQDLISQKEKLQQTFQKRVYEIVEGIEDGEQITYQVRSEEEILKRYLQNQ